MTYGRLRALKRLIHSKSIFADAEPPRAMRRILRGSPNMVDFGCKGAINAPVLGGSTFSLRVLLCRPSLWDGQRNSNHKQPVPSFVLFGPPISLNHVKGSGESGLRAWDFEHRISTVNDMRRQRHVRCALEFRDSAQSSDGCVFDGVL